MAGMFAMWSSLAFEGLSTSAVAAISSAILVLLGWQSLNFGWVGCGLFILTAAYVIGGFDSARDGLTTLLSWMLIC